MNYKIFAIGDKFGIYATAENGNAMGPSIIRPQPTALGALNALKAAYASAEQDFMNTKIFPRRYTANE